MLESVIAVVTYIALVCLVIYNIRDNIRIFKLRTKGMVRNPNELSVDEMSRVNALTKERRKWTIVDQIFFWISIYLAFQSVTGLLVFFIDLYCISTIVINKIELSTLKILTK